MQGAFGNMSRHGWQAVRRGALAVLVVSAGAWAQVKPPLTLTTREYLVLGEHLQARIELKTNGAALNPEDVSVSTSAGTAEDFVFSGSTAVGVFRPPSSSSSQVAILAAVATVQGKRVVAWQRLSLHGLHDLPLSGKPGESVLVTVGPTAAARVTLDGSGHGHARIHVPPGVSEARAGARSVRLESVPYHRIFGVVLDGRIAVDGVSATSLQALVVNPRGEPDTSAAVFFKARRGRVGPVRQSGLGIYEATYGAPGDAGDGIDTIEYGIIGDAVSRGSITLQLVRGPPLDVKAWLEPASYVAGGPPPKLWVTVADSEGAPVTDPRLRCVAKLGTFGAPRLESPGRYVVPFHPPDSFGGLAQLKIEVSATKPGSSPGRHEVELHLQPGKLQRLALEWDPNAAVSDGETTLLMRGRAVDAYDNPVPGVRLAASVDEGVAEPPQQTDTGFLIRYHPPLSSAPTRPVIRLVGNEGVTLNNPLVLLPPRLSWVLGMEGGFLLGSGERRAPVAGSSVAARLRLLPQLFASLELGGLTTSRWGASLQSSLALLFPRAALQLRFHFQAGPLVAAAGAGPVMAMLMVERFDDDGIIRRERMQAIGGEGVLAVGLQRGPWWIGVEGRYRRLVKQFGIVHQEEQNGDEVLRFYREASTLGNLVQSDGVSASLKLELTL